MKPKDDLRPEAAVRWLEKAKHNLDSAYLNHRHGGYTDTTCYFTHQTVEIVLKAFLVYYSIRFKKIHILPTLLEACKAKDKEFQQFEEDCKILNNYYVETKYPLDLPTNYPKEQAEEAIEKAEEIFEFVKGKLEQ